MNGKARQKRYRDRLRGGPPQPRKLTPCPSYAAWKRHVRSDQDPRELDCGCHRAYLDYHRLRRESVATAKVE